MEGLALHDLVDQRPQAVAIGLQLGDDGVDRGAVGESEPAADGGQRVARRDVEVLHATTDRVFVRGALAAGERVIADGVHRVVPGQRVEAVAAECLEERRR